MTHTWSVRIDLSGPHPKATGTNYVYLMVAVVTTGDGKTRLPFVRGLTSTRGEDVAKAVQSVVVEVEAVLGAKGIFARFHSDVGKEFYNEAVSICLQKLKLFQSGTGGYNPKSNGLAERFIGIIKHRASAYLSHAKLALTFWYWAAQQAAYVYRSHVLEAPMPKNCPTVGDRVLVRDFQGEKKSFSHKRRKKPFSCAGQRMWCMGHEWQFH